MRLHRTDIDTLQPVLRWEAVEAPGPGTWDVVVFKSKQLSKRQFQATTAAYSAPAPASASSAAPAHVLTLGSVRYRRRLWFP